MNRVFLANLHHAYAQTDGSYKWPNSREGDMLRQAKKEIEFIDAALKATANAQLLETSVENESKITERGQNLLPCPFCGSNNIATTWSRGGAWEKDMVICNNCDVRTGICDDLSDAIDVWNRRAKAGGENPIPQQPQGEICSDSPCHYCASEKTGLNCHSCKLGECHFIGRKLSPVR